MRFHLLALLLVTSSALAADATNREIARIYADAAIAEKDYAGAIRVLSDHLAEDSEDGGAWHLLGMTQLLAKQPERAIESFERALPKVPPESRGVTLYYQADAYLRKGDASRAADLLRLSQKERVSRWSAGRALSRGLAPGMSLQEVSPERDGRTGASLWVGTAYDSNVLLASDTSLATISRSDVASPRFNVGGNATYAKRGFKGGDLLARGGANFNAHTAERSQRLNSLGASVGAEWAMPGKGALGLEHAFGNAFALSFLNDDGFSFFSWEDSLYWRGRLDQGFGIETSFGIPVRYQKFAVDSGDDPRNDRTGLALGGEAIHRRRIRDQLLSGGLAFERLFAKGDNFKSWILRFPIGWMDPALPWWKLGARASVAPGWVWYPSSTNDRRDFNLVAAGSLFRSLADRTTGALSYTFVTNPSNVAAASYDKHTIAMQVIYDLL